MGGLRDAPLHGDDATPLTELLAAIEWVRELPQEEGHALAVQEIAKRLGAPADQAVTMLAASESQPTVTRELLLRDMIEAWLAGQRRTHGARGPAGNSNAKH